MNKFINQLQNLVAQGNLQKAFEELFNLLSICKQNIKNAESDIQSLRFELIMLSGGISDITGKFQKGLISITDYNVSKNRARHGFISTLDKIHQYKLFYNFLEDLEDEQAWDEAAQIGTIAAFEGYFSKYPKGKYIVETERIIAELKTEIRRKAQEEKVRRKILENSFRENTQPTHFLQPENRTSNQNVVDSEISPGRLSQWWSEISEDWKKALMNEIGAFGKPKEKHLKRMLELKIIDISGNRNIKNLNSIRHLDNVKTIDLSNTMINDLTPIETLVNLEAINISNTQVSSLKPLHNLKKLKSIICNSIDYQELNEFKRNQPNCKIK